MSIVQSKSLFYNFLFTFFRQIGVGVLNLLSAIIVARVYGAEGNGLFTLALLLPTLLGTFLNFGIGSSNIYFLGSKQVDIHNAIRMTFQSFFYLSVVGLLLGGFVLFVGGDILFPGVDVGLLWVALAIFPIVLLSQFLLSIFQGLEQFKTYNRLLILQPSLFLISLLVVVMIENKSLYLLVLLQMASSLIALLWMIKPIYILYNSSSHVTLRDNKYFKKALHYGWKSNLSNILGFLNYKIDIFLVNFFLNPVSAGIYMVAVVLSEKLWLISSAVSTVLLPRLSHLSSNEEMKKKLTPLVSRFVLWITVLGSIGLAVVAQYVIVWMFGKEYEGSVEPLLFLLPGIVILGVARVWANDIASRGKPEINMYISIVTLLSNVLGNIILIPLYGLNGAALATTISYILCSFITLVVYSTMTENSWIDSLMLKNSDIDLLKQVLKKEK